MIGTVISFFVVVFAIVILYMILTWGMKKLSITIEPELRTIIIAIVCLILLVLFLNWVGIWTPSGFNLHR